MGKKVTKSSEKLQADETKSARFVRVVSPRVKKALKSIHIIGYCAGSTYEYTPQQVIEIGSALTQAVDELMAKFSKTGKSESEFEFTV